ncbi:MAG: signal peptidase I [Candidatus Coprovivens sp.]
MKKRDKKNIFIFISLLIFIVLYSTIISKYCIQYSKTIITSFILIISFITSKLLGYKKDKTNKLKKSIAKIIIIELIIFFIIIYGIGLFTSFNKLPYTINIINILNNLLLPILIIIFSELLRYIIINANKDKNKVIIIITILLALLEITINLNNYTFNSLSNVFLFITSCILPISIKNIVMSYLTYHIGYKIPIMYRLISELYLYIIPYHPALENYLKSVVNICLPYLVYLYTSRKIKEYENGTEIILAKSLYKSTDLIIYGIIAIIFILVSGVLPIYMMGIGSGSMEPIIYKGDAIVLTKVNKDTELELEDIIAYEDENEIIVHRIIQINDDNTYVTKGDNNTTRDPLDVKHSTVKGKVLFRIPYLAYPSIWFSDMLEREDTNE